MAACRFLPHEIDAMPMHDVAALFAYWREQPPTHEILAAVHRVSPAPATNRDDPSGIGALISRAPGGRVAAAG